MYTLTVAALSIVGIASLVIFSRFASRSSLVSQIGGALARRTLSIYVTHAFFLEILAVAVMYGQRRGWSLPSGTVFGAVFIPVVTIAAVAVSLALYAFAAKFRLRWLYEPPAVLRAFKPGRRRPRML